VIAGEGIAESLEEVDLGAVTQLVRRLLVG
jgi:hypothetical protein